LIKFELYTKYKELYLTNTRGNKIFTTHFSVIT